MSAAARWTRFVAVGDSFTEGLDDPRGDGTHRGWADRIAEELAEQTPSLCYANLAVRGRLLARIVDEQVPAALALRPDLVSLAGGGNDVMRPRADLPALERMLTDGAQRLRDAGCDVLMFTTVDPSRREPGSRRVLPYLRGQIAGFNDGVRRAAERTGAVLVDLGGAEEVFDDPRLFSTDRLHLSSRGHEVVTRAVLEALGVSDDGSWREPAPPADAPLWVLRRLADLHWAASHGLPWVHRRLAGRSSGDVVQPKRPVLEPVREPVSR